METEDADKLESRVLLVEGDGTFGKSLLFFFFLWPLQCVAQIREVHKYLSQKLGPS